MGPAIIAASVSLVVAVMVPVLTSWRARRQAVADLFDAAISALLVAQTTRLYPSGGAYFDTLDWSADEKRQYVIRLQQMGLERWLQTQEEARLALSRLEPLVPEIRREITGQWEIREEQEPQLRRLLEMRRNDAIKSERLFRVRRPPKPLYQLAPQTSQGCDSRRA